MYSIYLFAYSPSHIHDIPLRHKKHDIKRVLPSKIYEISPVFSEFHLHQHSHCGHLAVGCVQSD